MPGMSISKQVKERVGQFEPGTLFGLADFSSIGRTQAVSLELSRLSRKGRIVRLTKGQYFVPKASRFGNLGPSDQQILDRLIEENGGYFGGVTALSRAGATNQVPAQITIRGARSTRKLKIGNLLVQFLSQGNQAASNMPSSLTDILEVLRLVKRTPNANPDDSVARTAVLIKSLSHQDVERLVDLSKHERPYVRAILGAILEGINPLRAHELKDTLNPISKFKIGIGEKTLPNKGRWNIL